MGKEDEHFPSEVRIDLMQKMKRASPKAMRPKTILSTNRKLLYNTFILHFFRAREYQSSDPLLSSTSPVPNIASISRCTFQTFYGNVEIVQNERTRRIVIDSDDSAVASMRPTEALASVKF